MPTPPAVYLTPGQVFASVEGHLVRTILGSCVAVCVWDARRGGGGVNHYMLPGPSGKAGSPRFGDVALLRLLEQVEALGMRRQQLRAMIFGGANVMAASQFHASRIGRGNIEVARRFLRDAGVPVVSEDVGGLAGRRVVFDTRTGTVRVTPIAARVEKA